MLRLVVVVTPYRPSARITYLQTIHEKLEKKYAVKTLGINRLVHPASILKLIAYRKKSRILHIHWIEAMYRVKSLKLIYPFLATLFLLILKIAKKILHYSIVITLHNILPHETYYPKVEYTVFRKTLQTTDWVIIHGYGAFKIANKLYYIDKQKIKIVMHGGWAKIYPKSEINIFKKYNIPKKCFILGTIGEIRRYKGIHLLLEAFRHVKKNVPKNQCVKLVIAGGALETPEYLKELHASLGKDNDLAKDIIIIPKYIPDDEITALVSAMDIGVLPYTEVTTPSAAMLFLSSGKPVVVPKLATTIEYCSMGGLFFKRRNVDDLAKKILVLINDKKFYQALSREAGKFNEKFSWDYTVDEIYKLYKEIR